MRKFTWLFCSLFTGIAAIAQNPATVFTIPNRNITLPCGSNCTSFSVQVPHIKQPTDYAISRPAYLPFAYTTPTGTEDLTLYDDDQFSSLLNFPFAFNFCFYGINYPGVIVGSNGIVTFDATNANAGNSWPLTTNAGSGSPVAIPYAGGGQDMISSTYYPKASIMGAYHDIDPTLDAGGQRKIEWRAEGTAPARRFIVSYNAVPMYSCNSITATHQIVIYENTGIVEVYVKDKPVCSAWNQGLAIIGVQDDTRTKAVAVPGKNAEVWGTTGMDSCYRFTPSGGSSLFKRAELLVNNVVVATNTTDSSTIDSLLNLNFGNICPTADSTAYVIRVVYGSCSNPAIEVSFTDTVFVKKTGLNATITKTDATCDDNGSITINTTSATPLQYSINNGTNYYSTNVFSNLAPGTYTVAVNTATGSCPFTQSVTIGLNGSISVNAGSDTTICAGASFTRTLISNAASYVWTSSGGLNSPSVSPSAVLSPQATTTYTITAIRGNCTATDELLVNVIPGATVNAGQDASIFGGQSYTMQATASAGTYAWTPATGLSSASILQPVATPQVTTTYTLQVTNSQGCISSDEIIITVIPYCIKPMEAFTPNGDGINDYWLITTGNCLKAAKAQVFNRYGAKVFESNDYHNDWRGMYNGKPLPDGTYYYMITYTLLNGKTEYKKGNVTILR